MLYRELAPISREVWEEIDERAAEVLKSFLSARKVVRVNGPKGMDYNGVNEGRLENIVETDGVSYGTYKILPLAETRIEFQMSRWELDNIRRGAKDIDYEALEKAAEKIALFEEDVIYNGLADLYIKGIKDSAENKEINLGKDEKSIMEALSQAIIKLRESYQRGDFDLVVGQDVYKKILAVESVYPLERRIKKIIGGNIVYNHIIDGAYLLPHDHEDLEMTIGQDFSIGYQAHDRENIRFFITESFTFRVLDPSIIIRFK